MSLVITDNRHEALEPRARRTWSGFERTLRRNSATLSAGAAAYLLNSPETALGTTSLVVFVVAMSVHVVRHHEASTSFVPFVRTIFPAVAPLLALLALAFLKAASVLAGLTVAELCLVAFLAFLGSILGRATVPFVAAQVRPTRILVVGSASTAGELAAELQLAGRSSFHVVGFIAPDGAEERGGGSVPEAGRLEDLCSSIAEHRVDLVLVSSDAPRLTAFETLGAGCLGDRVRVLELTSFYEHTFGHVPVAAINATWFQYVMHPRYSAAIPTSKRVLDLALSAACLIAFAPVLAILALAIKLTDGGPVLFRQVRIGEGGRPFSMLKLRSMRVSPPSAGHHWTTPDDARVTGVGRLMRKTHLDEMPQLINILRGEMSIVGPRPEQPTYVDRLEGFIPFYSRRHVVRPGVTGWAQVNCGYAGSDDGSTWKLCHDLYYLKHRSMGFDLLILAETLRTLVADPQFGIIPPTHSFVRTARSGTHEPVAA